MGILTNLIELGLNEEHTRRREQMQMWGQLAQDPNIKPEMRQIALDNLIKVAPAKGPFKELGEMFKGLVGKGDKGPQQAWQQGLAATGAPAQQVNMPMGIPQAPQQQPQPGQPPAQPGSLRELQGLPRVGQPASTPMTLPEVRPSAMLNPSELLDQRLYEAKRTAETQEQLRVQASKTIQDYQDEATLKLNQKTFAQNKQFYEELKKEMPESSAASIAFNRNLPAEVKPKTEPRPVKGSDPDLRAQGSDPNKWYNKTVDSNSGKLLYFSETATPAGERPTTAVRTAVEFEEILGNPQQHTPAELRAAKAWKAKQDIQVQAGMQPLNDQELDFWASYYERTGKFPPGGFGAAGQARISAIMKRVADHAHAEGRTADEIAANQAAYNADRASLTAIRKTRDAVVTFEGTARVNLQRFMDRAQRIVDLKSPILNHVFRGEERQIGLFGTSGPQADMDAARVVAYTEVAKVLNNPSSNAALTVDARAELNRIVNGDYTIPMLQHIASTLIQDMDTRKYFLDNQLSDITDDMVSQGGLPASPREVRAPGLPPRTPPRTPPAIAPPGATPTSDAQKKWHEEAQKWLKEN